MGTREIALNLGRILPAESPDVCACLTAQELVNLANNSADFAARCPPRFADYAKDARARAAAYRSYAEGMFEIETDTNKEGC